MRSSIIDFILVLLLVFVVAERVYTRLSVPVQTVQTVQPVPAPAPKLIPYYIPRPYPRPQPHPYLPHPWPGPDQPFTP